MKTSAVNIVGKIDGKTGIAQHTKSFISCLSSENKINFLDTRPSESDHSFLPKNVCAFTEFNEELNAADVSIFVDVTSNGIDDTNWKKVPVTKRKYIYSVFDSTEIPLSWADIINNHFDAVFVPSRFLVEVYRNSLVQKPIFYLPLALDLKPYLNIQSSHNNGSPFVFTFVGSREKRKNISRLIECFHKTFRNRHDVILKIHCALDFYNDEDYPKTINERYSNIEYTSGVLSDEDYIDLVSKSDCFISLSKGEGYSIVPRQFLAAGKPVILSDCFAHSEILNELATIHQDLGFPVDASIPVNGEYDHINNGGVYGLQYDFYEQSVSNILLDVVDRRDKINSNELATLRKEWAISYDYSTLTSLYNSIIQPSFCRLSTGNELEYGGITTSDANLANRISGKNFSLAGWQDISVEPEKIVVIGNDGGFFSVFNRFVSYLTWTMSKNPDSVVLPDWRIESMKRHWNTDKFMSFCYGTSNDGNIWLKLFKPLPYCTNYESYTNDQDLLYDAVVKDDYNEKNEPWLTYIHAYKLYKSVGFRRWRHWYNLYLNTYIHLQDHIQHKIDKIYDENLKGYTVISAHIRHPSHGIEQAGARMPTVGLYCDRIREILANESLDDRNCRIFLATDQDTVVEEIKKEFGSLVIYSADASRTTTENDIEFNKFAKEEQMKEGHQIQHLTAANPDLWSTTMAEEVIIDAYLLARGDYFVHVTSNIATAVSFINPRIKMIYCE